MTRSIALITLLLVAVPASSFPQQQTIGSMSIASLELPPDLTHISATGCHLRQYPVSVFNAQTKKADDVHYVEVIGFVKFDKTPGGEERVEWTVSLGTYSSPDADTIPKETVDRCVEWKRKLREAIVQDQHQRGHKGK